MATREGEEEVDEELRGKRGEENGNDFDGGGGRRGGGRRDPLEVLGADLMLRILSILDALSTALSLVSRPWHCVASCDSLWALKCEVLWSGKARIPRVLQLDGLSRLSAYSLSVTDGRRARITKHDLCNHSWEFCFSKAAPEHWRNLDPQWKGPTGQLMRRHFDLDGSQSVDLEDKAWGNHECSYCTVTSSLEGRMIRDHYVRINRWAQLGITCKQDRSWEMKNQHLCCYNNIPDANKPGGTGHLLPFS